MSALSLRRTWRCWPRVWLACACLVVALAGAPGRAQAAPPQRPNVLLIAIDDLACALGCYGNTIARTPHIDRLAATGMRFDRAYNQIPLCNPSRASLLTGLRPDETGVYDLERHFRDQCPDVVTLPQLFRQAGYRVARTGKLYHYNVPSGIGTDGLDDPASWGEVFNPAGRDKAEESQIFITNPAGTLGATLSWLATGGTDAEQTDGLIASWATEWMQTHGQSDTPFFLGVGFFRPHTPYVAPQHYFDMYPPESLRLPYTPADDRSDLPAAALAQNCFVAHYGLPESQLLSALQAYYACVSFVDAQVGRLLTALDELDLAKNTIVVLWSDHGYHLGEHGGIWQKRTLFEEGTRAPLIIRAPAHLTPGPATAGQPCLKAVEFVDIYPTLAALAALPAPGHLAGRSLVPLLQNPAAEWDERAITQILRPADKRLSEMVMGRSVRTGRYRYTEWNEGRMGTELYDHASDPQEFHNLALDPDERAHAVIRQLKPLFDQRARGTPPAVPLVPARL